MRPLRALRVLLLLGIATLAAAAPPARPPGGTPGAARVAPRPAAPAAAPGLFRFSRLNHGYSEPATAIDPIAAGPLTVRLSSPRNKLVLASHTLRLEPGADGLHSAELEVRFYGKGQLVADVALSGIARRFAA